MFIIVIFILGVMIGWYTTDFSFVSKTKSVIDFIDAEMAHGLEIVSKSFTH